MTTTNGWPGKPGVPLHPEKDGWHWLETEHGLAPWRWKENPESIMWESGWEAGDGVISPAYFAALGPCAYLGPCLTPDEATALQARADRNAAGFARVDAEAERDKFLHKQEIAALQKRVAELETALKAAAEDIGDWGAYASQYLQEKWDLSGEVKRYTAISEGKLPYRARYSMEEPKDE